MAKEADDAKADRIEQSRERIATALSRVEALMNPHHPSSLKLLMQMKEEEMLENWQMRLRGTQHTEGRSWLHGHVRRAYNSLIGQIFVTLLILLNFIVMAIEAQLQPMQQHPAEAQLLNDLEWAFLISFTVELAVNQYSHWFLEFWKNPWNYFDFFVVTISWVAIQSDGVSVLRMHRVLRAFRVVRLFRRIPSLRKIVVGIIFALPGVCNTVILLFLTMSIWSIMGVGFFYEAYPARFGSYSYAMLTCFQVMTFDSWASGLAWPLVRDKGFDIAMVSLYFSSFIFCTTFIMMNVVTAVLLDQYLASTSDVKMALDDSLYSLQKLEASALERLERMENYLKENNFKFAFIGMTAEERQLALKNTFAG